jgi:hypothetical protein
MEDKLDEWDAWGIKKARLRHSDVFMISEVRDHLLFMIFGVKIAGSLKVCVIVVIWIILRCLRQTYGAESLLVNRSTKAVRRRVRK